MKTRSHQLEMILKTVLHRVLESNENDDEMSCFAPYFKDEGDDTSIYSFTRKLTNKLLPKFRAKLPHL